MLRRARIEHVALWTGNLEALRAFYVSLGAASGPRYDNPRTGFGSYFLELGGGCRLELMQRPGLAPRAGDLAEGYAHIAIALDDRAAVDEAVAALRLRGIPVESGPRMTGDGYYEAVIRDPDGNLLELTCPRP